MRTNVALKLQTHEGGPSPAVSPLKELRRAVLANMLFEDQFYESGEDCATRIRNLVSRVPFADAAALAIEAREKMKLRHVPLLLTRELLRNHGGRKVGDLVSQVIQRPDECAELLAMYWSEGKRPLSNQLKIGLARALKKFNAYELAKWNKDAPVKLRDVLFLSHAKPRDASDERYTKTERRSKHKYVLNDHEKVFQALAENTLESPDTWEVALSGGADKKATFERLIIEKKLGALALLRNLRGMIEAGVPDKCIRFGLTQMKTDRVLPFRFITAARYAPTLEDALEAAMFRSMAEMEKLPGKTVLLIDHSGSMNSKVSGKSEITRFDAACGLAMILREKAEQVAICAFSEKLAVLAPRRGFALADQIKSCMGFGGTYLGQAVAALNQMTQDYDRLIVITDEQSADRPQAPHSRGYIVNVASYKNGIAYGPWVSIDGWSEAIFDYVQAYESDAT